MDKKLFVLFVLLFFTLFAVNLYAKDYSLPKAEIYLKINSDASVDVTEKISFSVSGSYTYAYRDIPKGVWEISNISVTENGNGIKSDITDNGSNTRITWYFAAKDELRIFTLSYRLEKAIVVYDDVAELYW